MRPFAILACSLVCLAALPCIGSLQAATLTVTTTSLADATDGACSLREAIIAINQAANRNECVGAAFGSDDRIHFNLPGTGVHTLVLTENLPLINRPVTIDGLTQPGANCDVWPPTLRVELDGQASTSVTRGLILAGLSGGSVVRGLVIGGMASTADNFSAGLSLASSGNRVECSYIGMRADGVTANPNRRGVDIVSSSDNIVGTDGVQPALGRRNLISGNLFSGVNTRGNEPSRNVIAGNYIGVDASGTQARSNRFGVTINAASNSPGPALDNVIGYNGVGSPEFARNVISGNVDGSPGLPGSGIDLQVNVQRTRIAGNYIGLDAIGNAAVPNGIGITIGSNASVRDNLVGFPSAQPLAVSGNVISGNLMDGISINGNNGTDRTFVVGNLIGTRPNGAAGFPNGRLGVDLNNGTRALLNGNVISGHTAGLRLWGTSARPMSNLINGEALPTGGPALDSRDNCITGNSAGTQVVYNGAAATTFLFENNWWGAANGPGGAGGGSGDPVGPEIDATPFLTTAPAGCAVTAVADLSVAVQAPDPVRAGETFTVTADVANAGPDPVAAASLQIALPAGLHVTPPSGCIAGGAGIECALPGIASGASVSLDFDVAAPATATGTVSLTVSVVSPTLDPAAGNNSLIVVRDIAVEADLALTLSSAPDPLVEGTTASFQLRVENLGPAQVDAASLVLAPPSGLVAPAWTCSAGGGGVCSAAGVGAITDAVTLPPAAWVEYDFRGRVDEVDQVEVGAAVAAPAGVTDTDAGNDQADIQRAVVKVHELRVTLDAPTPLAVEGELYTFGLRVDNFGPSVARAALIEQAASPALSDLLWTCVGAGGTCTPVGDGAVEDLVDLAAGAHVRYEVSAFATVPQAAQLQALVTAAAGTTDPEPGTDLGSYTLIVQPRRIFADGLETGAAPPEPGMAQ